MVNSELESVSQFLTGSAAAVGLLPWRALTVEDVHVIRDWSVETQTPATQRRLLRALSQRLDAAWSQDAAEAEPAPTEASQPRLTLTRARQAHSRRLATRLTRQLLEVCAPDDAEAARDGAVIALMLLAGLRRKAIVELNASDYDEEAGCLRLRSLRAAPRLIMLEGEAHERLQAWLAQRGGWSGPLFVAFRDGEPQLRSLSLSAVNRLLARRCDEAGAGPLTPRELRGHFLAQLRTSLGDDARRRCRYCQTPEGQPAWALVSLPEL